MSISLRDFFDPNGGGTPVSFNTLGDGVAGRVVDAQLVPDKFNEGKQVLLVKLADDSDEIRSFYCRSYGQKEAIGLAVKRAGATGIDVGGWLEVTFVGSKPLAGGKAMKLYDAKYEPAG